MCDQDMAGSRCRYHIPDELAIIVIQVQAVLAHQRADFKIKCDVHGVQDLTDLGFTDLVVTLVIEIDLVDGSASGND